MKELIKTIVIVLLVIVAVYYAFVVSKVNERMDHLNVADSLQAIEIDRFDHKVHDLELQFKGRGKHIQQFQRDLAAMDEKLDETARIFNFKIDSLGFKVQTLRADMAAELVNLKREQESTAQRLSQFQRQTNRSITDIQTAASRLNRELSNLGKRVKTLETPPEEEDSKRR